ncbi:lipase family alpha/beta hydrolase [Actinomycetospora corticicola]|uniref:lipase family alpha/beta hydrolase n=1 Tax=Actinomycetospora corticicola TaxID=663602 RepID=UPI001FEAC5AA|nr:alpha/beta fold hydrolase [Actinomycetospora corticicola]
MARADLRPTRLIASRTLFPAFGSVPGYEGLLSALESRFSAGRPADDGDPAKVRLGSRVVAFPYDFRASIVDTAQRLNWEVDRRLEALGWSGEPDKVVVVGHSMGGLVARQWVAQGNWERCRAVVTLGTPFAGAPKALDRLVNGLLPWWLGHGGALELLREWPGAHELAPQYRAVHDLTAQADDPVGTCPSDLGLPHIAQRLNDAAAVHTRMNEEWTARMAETACHAYRSRWHPTLMHATWDGKRLRSSKRRPPWIQGKDAVEAGDGTVPALAAIPWEQQRFLTTPYVNERHGPMVAAARCIEDIEVLLQGSGPVTTGVRSTDPAIGLDVADAYPAHEPVDVSAEIRPEKYGASPDVRLTCVLRRDGDEGPVVHCGPMDTDDGSRWAARLPPLDEGGYWLTVAETGAETAPPVSDWLVALGGAGATESMRTTGSTT